MTTEFGAGSSVSSFGTRRPKNHVVRIEEYRFTLAFNRCFRGPSVSHVQSCFFFVCCWNRDPRSSFIHFITTAVSAKYLSTYLNYSLHALSPLQAREITQPSKHAPLSSPSKKKKKTHPSLNSPKIPHHQSLNHPQNSPIRPPTRRATYPSGYRTKIRNTPSSLYSPTTSSGNFPGPSYTCPFASVITSKTRAFLESLHGGHLPYRHPTSQSPHQRAPLLSRPMSHARLEENTDPLQAPPAPRSHSLHLRSLYIGTFQTTLLLAPPPRPRFRAPDTRQRAMGEENWVRVWWV